MSLTPIGLTIGLFFGFVFGMLRAVELLHSPAVPSDDIPKADAGPTAFQGASAPKDRYMNYNDSYSGSSEDEDQKQILI